MGCVGCVVLGVCYCLWIKGEEGVLVVFFLVEIEVVDFSGLVFEFVVWGVIDLLFLILLLFVILDEVIVLLK